jgi:hypothetical protein
MKYRFIAAISRVLMLLFSACTPQAKLTPTNVPVQPMRPAPAETSTPAPTSTLAAPPEAPTFRLLRPLSIIFCRQMDRPS